MPRSLPPSGRLAIFIVATLLLSYGLWSLYSGWVVSTWARIEYRPGIFYWITVLALIVVGILNLAVLLRPKAR